MPSSMASAHVGHLIDPRQIATIDVLGPTIQFLTPLEDTNAPCIMRGTIPAGVSIPLHSHADPETFLMISGAVDGLVHTPRDHTWMSIGPGDLFHVPGHAKHAWRNPGRVPAVMLVISTARMGRFFQEIGTPTIPGVPPAPPSPEDIERLQEISRRYGYWNATPEENARVGISLPPSGSHVR